MTILSVALSEYDDFDLERRAEEERPPDPRETDAIEDLSTFFREHREEIFFSRQMEVQNEKKYFHWPSPTGRSGS
jgi:hypothetical protein